MNFEKLSKSFVICKHNSRVGQRTRPCGMPFLLLILLINGSPNAAVLPVPVCAKPTKSLCWFNKAGIACS